MAARMNYASGGLPNDPGYPPQQMSSNTGRGRARACTSCRQVKLRCDAREKAPAPCTRCETQGFECKMDPHFKRVPARRALEDVANRLNHLQTALGLDPRANASLSDYMSRSHKPDMRQLPFPGPAYQSSTSDGSSPPQDDTNQLYVASNFYAIEDETETGEWTLEGITFNAEQIRELFKHFDESHYKHGPFLEPCKSVHAFYEKSELLFWTVTMIGCFLFNEYDEFYWKLLPHHRKLLSSKMMGNRVTLSTVHAMLCMATWTYPVSTEYDDLTWMLCGAAIHTAMIMGLHKPGHTHEYSTNDNRDPGPQYIRNVTWMSIFIISTGISSWLGMPPPLGAASHLETITTLCRDLTIPKWYRARADVHRCTVQLVNSVDSKSSFSVRHSLIKVYEVELDRVKDTYEDVWNDDLEIEWQGARLYLYGIAFVQQSPTPMNNTFETTLAAKDVLLRGLAAAVECLTTVMSIKLPYTAPGENRCNVEDHIYQLGFYPKHFFRIGAFANYYLLWFLAVDSTASDQDREVAKTYITMTYQLLTSFTHSFEHMRAGQAIQLLASMQTMMPGPAATQVNSRLGAGFMYAFAMNAEGGNNPNNTPTLGIDYIGPDGPAHPKVRDPNAEQQSNSNQPTAHTSPQSSHGSHPAHSPPYHSSLHQTQQVSTPTSVHSAPELIPRSMPQDRNLMASLSPQEAAVLAASAGATSGGLSGMTPQQQMAMFAQMSGGLGSASAGGTGAGMAAMSGMSADAAAAAATGFMNQPMFDPELFAAMPSAQFQYSWGDWDASVLQHQAPQHGDPRSTAYGMGSMNLSGAGAGSGGGARYV